MIFSNFLRRKTIVEGGTPEGPQRLSSLISNTTSIWNNLAGGVRGARRVGPRALTGAGSDLCQLDNRRRLQSQLSGLLHRSSKALSVEPHSSERR